MAIGNSMTISVSVSNDHGHLHLQPSKAPLYPMAIGISIQELTCSPGSCQLGLHNHPRSHHRAQSGSSDPPVAGKTSAVAKLLAENAAVSRGVLRRNDGTRLGSMGNRWDLLPKTDLICGLKVYGLGSSPQHCQNKTFC